MQKVDSKVDIRLHPLSDDSHDNDAYLPAAVNKCDVSTSESRAKNDRGTTSQFVAKIDRVFEYWNREMHDGIFAFIRKQIQRIDKPEQNTFRRFCKSIYLNSVFEYVTMMVVFINTAMFTYTPYGMDTKIFAYITATQYVITMYSLLESLVALAGLGLVEYFSNSYNAFDFVIVILSAVASFISPVPCLLSNRVCRSTHSSLNSLISLRSFRCFTIFLLVPGQLWHRLVILLGDFVRRNPE